MRLLIKEWPNKTATVMTETGQVVWTFNDAETAKQVCRDWINALAENIDDPSEAGNPPVVTLPA